MKEKERLNKWGAVPRFSLRFDYAGGESIRRRASGFDRMYFTPEYFSPLLSWVNFYMPWDRRVLIAWVRHYDTFHPLIGNIIDLHTQFPLSRLEIEGVEDPVIKNVYSFVAEKLDIFSLIYDVFREYWLLGEAFAYLYWDEDKGIFTDAVLLPPEFIEVYSHPLLGRDEWGRRKILVFYNPDIELRRFTAGSEFAEFGAELLKGVPKEVLQALASGSKLKLGRGNLLMMIKKQGGYNVRGVPIILRVLKDLIHEDRLREINEAIAMRYSNPREIWKVGSEEHPATEEDLQAVAELVEEAGNAPFFNLVTHHNVSYECVGFEGKYPRIVDEFEWIDSRIITGLLVARPLITGEGFGYAVGSLSYRTLAMRYMRAREELEHSIIQSIFVPIAIKNGFIKRTPVEVQNKVYVSKELVLPRFSWGRKNNLLDDQNLREFLYRLVGDGILPKRILIESLGLDYDEVMSQLEKEEGTVLDDLYKEWRSKLIEEVGAEAPPPISLLRGQEKKSELKSRIDAYNNKTFKGLITRGGIRRQRDFYKIIGRQSTDDNKEEV